MRTLRGLSFKQPWCDGVLYGGKRIENRLKWKNSYFRDEVLLHAAQAMTSREYVTVIEYLERQAIDWRPVAPSKLVQGAIVGRAKVVGVVREGVVHLECAYASQDRSAKEHSRDLTAEERQWWMGGFALVLEDVVAFREPIPWKGMLGFFRTPFDRDGRISGGLPERELSRLWYLGDALVRKPFTWPRLLQGAEEVPSPELARALTALRAALKIRGQKVGRQDLQQIADELLILPEPCHDAGRALSWALGNGRWGTRLHEAC
jgi:hypothetical protein